jgi:hypothetical protein
MNDVFIIILGGDAEWRVVIAGTTQDDAVLTLHHLLSQLMRTARRFMAENPPPHRTTAKKQ